MGWDAVGALSELIGAVAVVASLLYLGRQVREGNRTSRAQTRAMITDQLLHIHSQILARPELFDASRRSMQNEALDPAEDAWIRSLAVAWFRYFENVHYQYRQGLYEQSEYEAQQRIWELRFAHERIWREEWSRVRNFFSPPFRELVDGYVAVDQRMRDTTPG